MKNDRQKKIIELVENRCIETQEQLLDQLRQCGFHSTQATVSRDIKELQIVKSLDGMGGYRYCLPHRVEGEKFGARFRVIFRECVTNIDYAQNIIVIKTMPGLGAAAGANIDSLKMPNMVGSSSCVTRNLPRSSAASCTACSSKEPPCFACCTLRISP